MQEQNNITNSLAHGKYSWGIIANSRFVKIVLVKISLHRPCFVDKNAVHIELSNQVQHLDKKELNKSCGER